MFPSSVSRWHSLSAGHSCHSSRPSSDPGVVAGDDKDPELPGACAVPSQGFGVGCRSGGDAGRARPEASRRCEEPCLRLALMRRCPVHLDIGVRGVLTLYLPRCKKWRSSEESEEAGGGRPPPRPSRSPPDSVAVSGSGGVRLCRRTLGAPLRASRPPGRCPPTARWNT